MHQTLNLFNLIFIYRLLVDITNKYFDQIYQGAFRQNGCENTEMCHIPYIYLKWVIWRILSIKSIS